MQSKDISFLASMQSDLKLTVTSSHFIIAFMFERDYFDHGMLIGTLGLVFFEVHFPKIPTSHGQVSVIKIYYSFVVM